MADPPAGKEKRNRNIAIAGGVGLLAVVVGVIYFRSRRPAPGGGGSGGAVRFTDMRDIVQVVQGPPGERGPRGPRGPEGDDDDDRRKRRRRCPRGFHFVPADGGPWPPGARKIRDGFCVPDDFSR